MSDTLPDADQAPAQPLLRIAIPNKGSLSVSASDILREAGYRQRERKQAAERERRRQEEAEAVANGQFHEDHRALVLARQVQRWRATLDLDAYLSELAAVVAGISDELARQDAQAWLDWARGHRDRTDPLRQPITMPPLSAPSAADLAPYLSGRSARQTPARRLGPGRRRRRSAPCRATTPRTPNGAGGSTPPPTTAG